MTRERVPNFQQRKIGSVGLFVRSHPRNANRIACLRMHNSIVGMPVVLQIPGVTLDSFTGDCDGFDAIEFTQRDVATLVRGQHLLNRVFEVAVFHNHVD